VLLCQKSIATRTLSIVRAVHVSMVANLRYIFLRYEDKEQKTGNIIQWDTGAIP
jgi:hypothetical protein